MALRITFVHIICLLLAIPGTWSIESPPSKPDGKSGMDLPSLLKLVPSIGDGALQKDYVSRICPQLWDKERDFNVTAGYLGSLEEINTFCHEKPSEICKLAVWMSSYLCNATQGLGSAKNIPKPPEVKDFQSLDKTDNVCARLGSDNLKSDILAAVTNNGNTQVQSLIVFFPMVHEKLIEMCPITCVGEDLRMCQVILQGLRTVVAWEELKKKQSTAPNNEASPTEPIETTGTAAPALTNVTASNVAVPVQRVQNVSNTNSNMTKEGVTTSTKVTTAATSSTSTTTTVSPAHMSDEEEFPPVENPGEAEPDSETTRHEPEGDLYDEDDADKGMEETFEAEKKPDTERKNESPKSSDEQKDYSVDEPEDTHFIIYFLVCLGLIVTGYVVYHRRNRVMALIVEGRSGSQRRRGTSRSRTSSASYKRLDNNLEEVVTSSRPVRSSNVIY